MSDIWLAYALLAVILAWLPYSGAMLLAESLRRRNDDPTRPSRSLKAPKVMLALARVGKPDPIEQRQRPRLLADDAALPSLGQIRMAEREGLANQARNDRTEAAAEGMIEALDRRS